MTMLGSSRRVGSHCIRNDATARSELFLPRRLWITLVHLRLALVECREFLGWNELRNREVGIGMNLFDFVVLLLCRG